MCVWLKIKCDQYWPADSEPLFYGDLEVKILNENISTDWHTRELRISLVGYMCTTTSYQYYYYCYYRTTVSFSWPILPCHSRLVDLVVYVLYD